MPAASLDTGLSAAGKVQVADFASPCFSGALVPVSDLIHSIGFHTVVKSKNKYYILASILLLCVFNVKFFEIDCHSKKGRKLKMSLRPFVLICDVNGNHSVTVTGMRMTCPLSSCSVQLSTISQVPGSSPVTSNVAIFT